MADFLYSTKVYDISGMYIHINLGGGSPHSYQFSVDADFLAAFTLWKAGLSGSDWDVTLEDEQLFLEGIYLDGLTSLDFSDNATATPTDTEKATLLANMFGFNDYNNTFAGTEAIIYSDTWGFRIPRDNELEGVSISGGFVGDTKEPVEFYRQRETKVTGEATYSTRYKVRRGFTYNYKLNYTKVAWFDRCIEEWADEVVIATSTDMNVNSGICINSQSGALTKIYEVQDIYETTLTLLEEV